MSKGGGVDVPQPTAQEKSLLDEQLKLLQLQRQQLESASGQFGALAPLLFQQAGLQPQFGKVPVFGPQQATLQAEIDKLKGITQFIPGAPRPGGGPKGEGGAGKPTQVANPAFADAQKRLKSLEAKLKGLKPTGFKKGDITGFKQIVDPLKAKRGEIEKSLLDRELAALQGKLPVDPALQRSLEESGINLQDMLRSQLGPGFSTSTPGIQALAEFEKRKNETLDAARRGDINLAETLGQSRQAGNQSLIDAFFSRTSGTVAGPQSLAGSFGQAAGNPLAFLQQQRQMQLQAALGNQSSQSAAGAGFGSLVGQLGAAAIPFIF